MILPIIKQNIYKEKDPKRKYWDKYHTLKKMSSAYFTAAEKRNIDSYHSDDYFELVAQQPCYLCGTNPTVIESYGCYPINGIDRVDNCKGYIPGNMMACCTICNKLKGNKSLKKAYHTISIYLGRQALNLHGVIMIGHVDNKNDSFGLVGLGYELSAIVENFNRDYNPKYLVIIRDNYILADANDGNKMRVLNEPTYFGIKHFYFCV